jgi:hydroxyacylglutathione hydrolase
MNMALKKQIGEDQQLIQLRILEDNYVYVLTWDTYALIVDPGDGKQALELLSEENLTLKNILITHYHYDHTGGNEVIKKKTDCRIIGPEDDRIPEMDRSVDDEEELFCGPFTVEVIATPGHTKPHVVYFIRDLHLLFSGDLLFSGGCGRLFEGTAQEMWHSLEKVRTLPDDTAIYCGHEYTVKNLMFACDIEPDNKEIQAHLQKAQELVAMGKSTIPSSLAIEKKINPFLRTHEEALRQALGMPSADPITVFAHLRGLRDKF